MWRILIFSIPFSLSFLLIYLCLILLLLRLVIGICFSATAESIASILILANGRAPSFHQKCSKKGLTHPCFSDDLVLFSDGSQKVLLSVKKIFEQFYHLSGLPFLMVMDGVAYQKSLSTPRYTTPRPARGWPRADTNKSWPVSPTRRPPGIRQWHWTTKYWQLRIQALVRTQSSLCGLAGCGLSISQTSFPWLRFIGR